MKNLKSYLLKNVDELKTIVAEINAYNGSLDYLEAYANEEYTINELFSNPYEALKSSCYGYYNISNDLVRFNSYGNIESLNENEYEIELIDNIDDIIEELLRIFNKIDISKELYECIKKML